VHCFNAGDAGLNSFAGSPADAKALAGRQMNPLEIGVFSDFRGGVIFATKLVSWCN